MLELWVIYALIAALFFSIGNLVDKVAITKEMKDPIFASVLLGFVSFVLYCSIGFFAGDVSIGFNEGFLVIVAAIVSIGAVYFYYESFQRGDVSRITILMSLYPLAVLVLAFIFLGERLGSEEYFGIFLMVAGASLLSFNRNVMKKEKVLATVFILIAVILFGVRENLTKFVSGEVGAWAIIFWFGVGNFIAAVFLLMVHHPHLRRQAGKGVKHLVVADTFSVVARILLILAIAAGPVSLVSALVGVRPVIVFAVVFILSRKYPHLLEEDTTHKVVLRRLGAIGLIIGGGFLIV